MTTRSPLRLSRTHFPVTALGFGRRLGIWVQGCPLACAGCMSRDTWSPTGGVEVAIDELATRWRECVADGADGITISGGEPLAQPGPLADLLGAVAGVRTELTAPGGPAAGRELDIIVYTGYELPELDEAQQRAMAYADVLVTGRYEVANPTMLIWRGSANQRMHLRTPLGRRRYQSFVDCTPEHPHLQVRADPDGVWLVGVPRAGTLPTLERELRRAGIPVEKVTWRPESARTAGE